MENNIHTSGFSGGHLYIEISFEFLYYFFVPFYTAIIALVFTYYQTQKFEVKVKSIPTQNTFEISNKETKKMDPLFMNPFWQK